MDWLVGGGSGGCRACMLWLNPRVFPAVTEPRSWAAKGIYGEKLWLLETSRVPGECRLVLRWLMIPAIAGFILLIWGLVRLSVWPTLFGAMLGRQRGRNSAVEAWRVKIQVNDFTPTDHAINGKD